MRTYPIYTGLHAESGEYRSVMLTLEAAFIELIDILTTGVTYRGYIGEHNHKSFGDEEVARMERIRDRLVHDGNRIKQPAAMPEYGPKQ